MRASPYFRPALCIAVILGALVVLVTVLSRPAEAWMSLEARCAEVALPVAGEWDLPAPDDLSAFWGEAALKNLEALTLDGSLDPRREWKLELGSPAASAPPSVHFSPGSRATRLKIRVESGTRLAKPARLEWHHSAAGSWTSEISFFEGKLEAANLGAKRNVTGVIRNNLLPATLTLASRTPPAPQLPAYLSIAAPAALSWAAPQPEFVRTKELSAAACRIVALRSDAVSLAPSSGAVQDIHVVWRSPATLNLTVDNAAGLQLQTSGIAGSVREGGRELLPTLFEQLARGAPERRGLFGVSIALIVMAAGIYLKRALEILAKLHLPEPK